MVGSTWWDCEISPEPFPDTQFVADVGVTSGITNIGAYGL